MNPYPAKFKELVFTATFAKFLLNTCRRLIYPFAPELARGLNTDLSAITSVIAVNNATALLAPLGAGFADRYGYRRFMLYSLVVLAVGCLALGLRPAFYMLMICFFLAGLAKAVFDTSLQAYLGSIVPYDKRGKIIGITELAWAGSTLIGIPLAGLVMARFSWQAPFFIISALSFISFLALRALMPPKSEKNPNAPARSSLRANWRSVLKNRQVKAILLFVFLISLANDNFFVVYGAWLEKEFHLSLAAIGLWTIFIGLAEALGEGFTAVLSDRIGLMRAILLGTFLCGVAYFLLPMMRTGLPMALAGLFIIFFFFEFSIVTAMSLATELTPALRASTMSAFFATAGLGRVAGAFTGGMLWNTTDMTMICMVSGAAMIAGLAALVLGFFLCPAKTG